MRDAVAALVHDGDSVAIEGFTHLICFAAGHEIIRQGRRDLTLIRMTPDVIYDQMIAAGVASKLVFSWLGNPGVGSLHAIRRVTEGPQPTLELEEYSHFGMVGRYTAGAVASFAFGAPVPIVDGNIARVLARLFDFHEQIDSASGATRNPITLAEMVASSASDAIVPMMPIFTPATSTMTEG